MNTKDFPVRYIKKEDLIKEYKASKLRGTLLFLNGTTKNKDIEEIDIDE